MDISAILGDSFHYAKEALMGKWARWVLLIISTIIFPLMMGYVMEIYRGKTPAPELEHWGKLFIDGLKLFVAGLIYLIPIAIVFILTIGMSVLALIPFIPTNRPEELANNPEVFMKILPSIMIGIFIVLILGIIISLVAQIGFVRMARKDSFGEAFNFTEIFATIGKIGWGGYILSLIVLYIVVAIIMLVLQLVTLIPYLGFLIFLIFIPLVIIFEARYITGVYESGGSP